MGRLFADHGKAMLMAQGVKEPSSDWFNAIAMIKRKRAINEDISPETAQIWLDLLSRGCLPRFAEKQLSVENMKLAAID